MYDLRLALRIALVKFIILPLLPIEPDMESAFPMDAAKVDGPGCVPTLEMGPEAANGFDSFSIAWCLPVTISSRV